MTPGASPLVGRGPWRRADAAPERGCRAALTLALVAVLFAAGCQQPDQSAQAPNPAPATAPAFVGGAKCAGCHVEAADAYRASDHARAMQAATDQTVLGNFDQARVSHRGGTAAFFRRDGKFLVRTEGPDGKPGEFEITYTFGVTPLQQYLVPFPDGRLQALGLAWDTRPRDAVAGADQVPERTRADGPPHRLAERGRLVAEPVHEPRPDHRDVGGLRQEVEAVRAVLKVEALHRPR